MKTEAELTEEHLLKLRGDLDLYSSAALKIQTKEGKLAPLEANFAQKLVRERADEQKAKHGRVRMLILKARQEGISTWCASRIYHGSTLWSNRRSLVLADKLDRAGEIFSIYERFDREVPAGLCPPQRTTQRRREMSWKTDSRITVETAGDPDAGRGSTLHYLHASELAMWPRADETWIGLMQAVPTDSGEVYVESTAKGIGNLFHRLWVQAEAGDSDWIAVFLPWWIHDEYRRTLTEDERADITATQDPWERRALDEGIEWEGSQHLLEVEQLGWRRAKIRDDFLGDERTFRQEYPATAREAFVTSGDGFFDSTALVEYEIRSRRPDFRGNFDASRKFHRSERGYVHVWEMPDPNGHYVIGADTAEGKVAAAADASLVDELAERGGRDFSSADILKVSELIEIDERMVRQPCLRQVGQVHGRMAPEVFADQVWGAACFWTCPGPTRGVRQPALTAIERNHSSGQTVILRLQKLYRHPNLFRHKRMNVRQGGTSAMWGWITDGTTRMPMLDTLAALVREGTLDIFNPRTLGEMFTFVRGDDGRPAAQEGTHDDRVISLAIAAQMSMHHREAPAGEPVQTPVYDTPTGL